MKNTIFDIHLGKITFNIPLLIMQQISRYFCENITIYFPQKNSNDIFPQIGQISLLFFLSKIKSDIHKKISQYLPFIK